MWISVSVNHIDSVILPATLFLVSELRHIDHRFPLDLESTVDWPCSIRFERTWKISLFRYAWASLEAFAQIDLGLRRLPEDYSDIDFIHSRTQT